MATLEAERPEVTRGGRGRREGAEEEASGVAAGGEDGEAVGAEAGDERVDLRCGRGGEIGARAKEEDRGGLRVRLAVLL